MAPQRPTRLNAAPRRITRKKVKKAPRPVNEERTPAIMYWIAGFLVLLLGGLIFVCIKAPEVKAYLARYENPPHEPLKIPEDDSAVETLPPVPVKPKTTEEAKRQQRLEEKVRKETQEAVERPAPTPVVTAIPPEMPPQVEPPAPPSPPPEPPKPPAPPVVAEAKPIAPMEAPPVLNPPPITETLPPVAQPAPGAASSGGPARALPLDATKLDTERIAAYQVALERIHFSCGFIDGNQGMRTQRMLRAFQASRGLAVTGLLDAPTQAAVGEPGEPFLNYIVTAADLASIMPKPSTWREKSTATRLGYNDMWEMLAEKFHCTRAYLKALNRDVKDFVAGTEVVGPKVYPAAPVPKAASLRVNLGETTIEALDGSGQVIGFFPCSIAKDKAKRPNGALTVKSVVPNPDYTFDPALFADAAAAEGLTKKMVLPPGPRNPVGSAWIGLSLPGYGIHGTPEPENISRTQSHGCFRLANWNAEKVLKMVKVGTPVDVQP